MEDIIPNEKKEDNSKPVNIFFFIEGKMDFYNDIKDIINKMKDKFKIKGEFDKSSLLSEIGYYLGIRDSKKGKIDKKQIQNVVILYTSFNNSKDLLFQFITKFEKGIVKNDDHPFFIILPYENEPNFNVRQLIIAINNFQEKINNSRKLDSRNISFESKNSILEKLEKIYNYFNENDEKKLTLMEIWIMIVPIL